MDEIASGPNVRHLFSYTVASKDMFFSGIQERRICVYEDPCEGFQVIGEIPGQPHENCVDLCQILLEYALTCQSTYDTTDAQNRMEDFGRKLGEAIAIHVEGKPPIEITESLGPCVMEHLLNSMQAHCTVNHVGAEWLYSFDRCPLCETAIHMGICETTLAHSGLNALCQTLIQSLDPSLVVTMPASNSMELVFSVVPLAEV
jgi:hypothetical protein